MDGMEQIDVETATREIQALGADETTLELILNNIRLYNNLVYDYEVVGITKQLYLTYQLNVQIGKQMNELRKLMGKKETEQDEFEQLVKGLKGHDEQPPRRSSRKQKHDEPGNSN